MRRVLYLYLPSWPIDRLRRMASQPPATLQPGSPPPVNGAAPAERTEEAPFATVVESGGRRLVAAVNPAAAAAGIAPAMPLADALSFVPRLVTAPAAPAADAAALAGLAEWCQRYSPWTAPDFSSGEGLEGSGITIEITGSAHLWGGEAPLAADLAARLTRQGIAHRVAIAGTLGAAWALARFMAADGRLSLPPPAAEPAALAPLPVAALRLDPAIAVGLRRVGLRRIGDLYAMPREALGHRFGETVARRLDQALGAAAEPLSPQGEAPVRRVRLSFAEPIADPADLRLAIERLAQDLVRRLAQEGAGARRLDLAFHRVDGRVEHIRLGTARPSRDPRHLAGLLTARLESVDPGLGVEDMILALFAAEKLPPEQIAMPPFPPLRGNSLSQLPENPLPPAGGRESLKSGGKEASDWDDIAPLLDRLGARLGLAALGRLAARQSHIPERASVCLPAAEDPHPNPNPSPLARAGIGVGICSKTPRPVRLLQPPEPIEAAWLLPDDPPFRFTWRRRPHRVRLADGPERIAEEWWTATAAPSADAIRDYYRVEDAEGRRFWLFRAGLPGGGAPSRWFLHGIFA